MKNVKKVETLTNCRIGSLQFFQDIKHLTMTYTIKSFMGWDVIRTVYKNWTCLFNS